MENNLKGRSRFPITGILFWFTFTGVLFVFLSKPSFALNGADVAIYNDSIAAPDPTTGEKRSGAWQEGVTAIKNMLTWMGLTYEEITYNDLNYSTQNFSRLYKVMLFPGGFAYWYNYWISLSGKTRIRNFVTNGGGYFGICAGSFFASDVTVWEGITYDDNSHYNAYGELTGYDLDLFPGTGTGPISEIAPWPTYDMTTINFQNENEILSGYKTVLYSEDILYYGGPYFTVDQGAQVEVLGSYSFNGKPAIVGFGYGSGRVVLLGPHPEIEEDSDRDGITIDKEEEMNDNGSDWELVSHIFNWLTKASNYVSEVLESDINLSYYFVQAVDEIVGAPDFSSSNDGLISLGPGGYIIVKMSEAVIDGSGDDLKVYECGSSQGGMSETYYVYGTSNCDSPTWTYIGYGSDVTSFDLSGTGLSSVLCLGLLDAGTAGGKIPGADFDAVEGLNSSSSSGMVVKIHGTTVTISVDPVPGAKNYILVYTPTDFGSTGEYDMGNSNSVSFNLWSGAAFNVYVEVNMNDGTRVLTDTEYFQVP